jgi:integrase
MAIRIRLQLEERIRDLAMFNLAIDSKLRACDLTALRVDDVAMSGRIKSRAIVTQKKTGRPVQFEITEQTRDTVSRWIDTAGLRHGGFLFPSRICAGRPIRTRQYARLVSRWISSLGLDPARYGTHSLRRTKPTLIYRRTGNLRAVQLLLGHTKLDYVQRWTMSLSVVTRFIINENGGRLGT